MNGFVCVCVYSIGIYSRDNHCPSKLYHFYFTNLLFH